VWYIEWSLEKNIKLFKYNLYKNVNLIKKLIKIHKNIEHCVIYWMKFREKHNYSYNFCIKICIIYNMVNANKDKIANIYEKFLLYTRFVYIYVI